jgi:hypothetical protein
VIFTGVAVSRSESRLALQRIDGGMAETASKIAASLPVVQRRPAPQRGPVSKAKAEQPARAQRKRTEGKSGRKGA